MSQDWSAFLMVLMTIVGKYRDDFADLGSVQLMFVERHVPYSLSFSSTENEIEWLKTVSLLSCSPDASHPVQDAQSFTSIGQ